MRNRFSTLLIVLSLSVSTYAQQMYPLSSAEAFNRQLATETQKLTSIESDFVQEKYLDVFDEKIISKGEFYYKKSNKICLKYQHPLHYMIVINGGTLQIVADGKKSMISSGSNKIMSQMQDMLTACMVGDLSKLSTNYKLSYFENEQYYLVSIKPTQKAIQAYITNIDIYFDKKDMSVHRMRLSETANNYTEYIFQHKKFNSLTDEKVFEVHS